MKIGYLQFKPEFGKVKENIEKIRNMISGKDFDLLVLPELSNSGYLFASKEELEEYSEKPDSGIFCNTMLKISEEKNCYIVAGFCERSEEETTVFYNSSILACPQNKYFLYRKIHLFNEEKFLFSPGNLHFQAIKITGPNFGSVSVGMMICLDWLFPESARTLALQGAQIICHPSNLVMPYCQTAMFARAVENQIFIITANRTGKDVNGSKEVEFTGKSVILDTKGNYLSTGSFGDDECVIVDINPIEALNKNVNQNNNVFTDRKTEFYNLN